MNVLLINLPPVYIKYNKYSYRFPLGLSRIVRILKAHKHHIIPFDLTFHDSDFNDLCSIESLLCKFANVDVIAIGGLVSSYNFLTKLIPLLKRYFPGSKIIIGGGIASEIPEYLLYDNLADFVVIGEGEVTIIDLLEAINNDQSFHSVKGIAFLKNNKAYFAPPQKLIKNLKKYQPDYDCFDLQKYIDISGRMLINTSRGCPNQCRFCFSAMGKKYRTEPIDNIISHLKDLKKKYIFTHFSIVDQLFLFNAKRVEDFCRKYIEMGAPWKWHCSAYAGFLNDDSPRLLKLMKKANCDSIGMGIESGSQTILNNMNKGVTTTKLKIALKMINDAGIITGGGIIFGYPGENHKTIKETSQFFKALRDDLETKVKTVRT